MLETLRHYTYLTPGEWACITQATREKTDARVCGEGAWTSWSLLDFRYRRHDTLGYLFAVSSFLPVFIVIFMAGFASAAATRERRVSALVLLLCLVGSTALNTVLKALIRSPRPPHPAAGKENYSTVHGMPSDHAQFIAFFTCYLVLRARQQTRPPSVRGLVPGRKAGMPTTATAHEGDLKRVRDAPPLSRPMCLCFACVAAVVAVGRVYNGYHTVEQVCAGAVVGAALAWVCTRRRVQRVLGAFAERAVIPVMLLCTSWSVHI